MVGDGIPCRYVLAFLGFWGIFNVYLCRINLSMAIVPMVGSSSVRVSNVALICDDQRGSNLTDDTASLSTLERGNLEGEFAWDSGAKGILLGSYYYGYVVSQIPGGWLAYHYGFKWVWGLPMALASILTALTPLAALDNYAYLVGVRILIGLCHGVAFPAMHGAWAHWAPPNERSRMVACHCAGASVGTVVMFPLGGILAEAWGWRSIFYLTGISSGLWCLMWAVLVFDTPDEHPRISAEERAMINQSLVDDTHDKEAKKSTPWRAILSSRVVWAVSLSHLSSNWGVYQLNTMLPTYLDTVLGFDIKSNGVISAIPFVLQSFVVFFAGWITDQLKARTSLRIITLRKWNTAIGLIGPAILVVLAGYMGCNRALSVLCFTLSMGLVAFTLPGSKTSMLDFAPSYSGIIFGFSNTWANMSGFLAPTTTGLLLDSDNSLAQWQLIFWVSAMVYLPGFVAFQIFGADQLQPWAKGDPGLGIDQGDVQIVEIMVE